jgi:hypothetical protein
MSRSKPGARNAYCSFCRKSHTEVGLLVEGPAEVYICCECIELCQEIIDQEKVRRSLEDPLGYYRGKVERLIGVFEQAKWENANQIPSLRPLTLSVQDVEKILFHMAQMRGLLGGGTQPYTEGRGTSELAPDP